MLPHITNFTQFGWKREKFKFLRFLKHKKKFQKSSKAKLLKLDRFAWYHWMRKYLFYFGYKFLPRPQAAPDDAQLPKTSSMKNEKTLTLISQMAQNIELIMPRPVFFTSSEEWPNILHMLYSVHPIYISPQAIVLPERQSVWLCFKRINVFPISVSLLSPEGHSSQVQRK